MGPLKSLFLFVGAGMTSFVSFVILDILITIGIGLLLNKMEIVDDSKADNKMVAVAGTLIAVLVVGVGLIITSIYFL